MALFESLHILHELTDVSLVVTVLSLLVFLSNYTQFCIDQLTDASPGEIVSFICLYAWFHFASYIAVQLLPHDIKASDFSNLSILSLPILWTISVCTDHLFNHSFVKEPIGQNPLMLIFKVLEYALKTRHPRLRSAFTYWEDKPYSRLDLAKMKYGGPFSTEQVEDVKTFFRVTTLIVLGALFYASTEACSVMSFFFYSSNLLQTKIDKSEIFVVLNIGNLAIMLIYPIYEVLLTVVLYKCIQRITILKRIVVGMALMLLGLVQFTSLGMGKDFFTNETAICAAAESSTQDIFGPMAYYYSVFKLLECTGKFIFLVGSIEFICAQSPYSMKGVLFAGAFSCTCFYGLLMYYILFPFHIIQDQQNGILIQCIFWYFLTCTLLACFVFILFIFASYFYKRRVREDTLPNQQCFAEQYYESIYNIIEN